MDKKVTLEDIALKMNTSIVTVSNALAGRSGVSSRMREEILKTAHEMGYQKRKRRDKASSVGGTYNYPGKRIGVVVSHRYLERYTSFYWEMYQRVVLEASREGCFVLLEILNAEQEEKMQNPLLVEENQIDALIILGMLETRYLSELHKKCGIPMLFLDFDDQEVPCDAVVSNGFFGMYQMTNYLIHNGHRRIGFLGEYYSTNSIMDRYQGYCKSLMEHGIEIREDWVIPDRDLLSGNGIEAELPEDMPTAFVCNCDLTADELAERLEASGRRVPEDISLVSYDDFLLKGTMFGRLTTYAVDMDAMARQSIKLIFKRFGGELAGKTVRTIDGKPVIRSSVKKISEGDREDYVDYL